MVSTENAGTPALPLRPRLKTGVVVHPPVEPGAPWVIERVGGSYFRVGADIARLANLMTGEHDLDELAEVLGPPWTLDAVTSTAQRLMDSRLLDDGTSRRRRQRRIAVLPPMTIQVSVLDPTRLLGRSESAIAWIGRRGPLTVLALLILAGLVALVVRAGEVVDLVSQPLRLDVLVIAVVGGFVFTAIHELAHAATLVHYGGRPRRLGVMLFYGVPAFFCDVSDGWRLPRNQQRVRVALAGIFAQFACAGLSALAAVVAQPGTVRDGLLVLALSMFVATTMNLIPFVKLDGYLALMSHLDISNLRSIAMDDARNAVASVVFGARRSPSLPGRRWVVPYGLLCMAFPLYLVGFVAFGLWADAVTGSGAVGAVLVLSVLLGLVWTVLRGGWRLLRAARDGGASTLRVVASTSVAVVAVGVAAHTVTVTSTVVGSYAVDDRGARLVVADSAVADDLETGQEVELRTNGFLLRRPVGAADVGEGASRRVTLPSTALMPFDVGLSTPATYRELPLVLRGTPDQTRGRAEVRLEEQPLWRWAWTRYVRPIV